MQKEQKSSSQQSSLFAKYYNPNKVAPTIKQEEKKAYVNFYSLLDKLKTLPINKKETISTIVGELLKFKKYPADIIKVEFENIPQSAINNAETITKNLFITLCYLPRMALICSTNLSHASSSEAKYCLPSSVRV